jgi:hypothetical protein
MAVKGTAEPTPRLTAIELAGFKSAIDPVRVNFRDITILAGANSTGKSTIMQPLLLIKQTIEKPFDPGALAIDGPLVRFTSADQFFSHGTANDTERKFTVAFEDGTAKVKFTYGRSEASGIDLMQMSFGRDHKEYSWKNGQKLDDGIELISEELSRTGISKRDLADILRGELRVTRDRVLLVARFMGRNASALAALLGPIASPAEAVIGELRNLIYLPGLRGNPERHYVISAGGSQYPGNFNDYVASIIHLWGTTADIRLKSLENNLKLLGLTWRVTDHPIGVRRGREGHPPDCRGTGVRSGSAVVGPPRRHRNPQGLRRQNDRNEQVRLPRALDRPNRGQGRVARMVVRETPGPAVLAARGHCITCHSDRTLRQPIHAATSAMIP